MNTLLISIILISPVVVIALAFINLWAIHQLRSTMARLFSPEPTQTKPTETSTDDDLEELSLEEVKRQLEAAATGDLEDSKPRSDDLDSNYEFLIGEALRAARGTVFYANYTKSSVEVTGALVQDYCVRLLSHQQMTDRGEGVNQSLEDWDEQYNSAIRFVLRIALNNENYLIWGITREEAYLHLFGFLARLN